MILRPQPLPDELDRSYLGAVMRLNGVTKEDAAMDLVAQWDSTVARAPGQRACLEALSKVAGVELTQFVREHSTLSMRRAVTSYQPLLPHGCPSNIKLVQNSGMRKSRPGAYFCPSCVEADLATKTRSYWRRTHQTPGLFWCPTHGSALGFVADESCG